MTEIVRLRQQQQNSQELVIAMEDRLETTEKKHQQIMSFLAKALKNPSFFQNFAQNNRELIGIGRKRRLAARPSVENLQEVELCCSKCVRLSLANAAATDQSALLAIQSELTFDPTNTVLGGNWTTKTSFCYWFGVSCSKRRQRVTALRLPYMGLQGTISPHIGNLSFLVLLDIQNNSFTGSLPNEISHLHRLRILIVQVNQLEGTISPALKHCQNLETLSLSYTRLSGQIPKEMGFLPKLRNLYLGVNNSVAGNVPVSLGNISTLQKLSLPEAGLTCAFPRTQLILSSLVTISLFKNNISGSLHDMDICHYWPNIQILQFANNVFSGKLPSRIDRCREIVVLSLSNLKFLIA